MYDKLDEEEIQTYREVGELTAEVREKAREMVNPGQKLFTIAEEVEEMIREGGAQPAFPCNLSINEKAAHYSPPNEDETEVEIGDLVKIDIGAHIDGYIADTATTVFVEGEEKTEEKKDEASGDEDQKGKEKEETGKDSVENEEETEKEKEKEKDMVESIEHVLEEAIKTVEPGIDVGEIGAVIEKTAEEHGYSPISNLTGHNLERYSLHGGISIPNVEEETGDELEAGDVIALEPFITDGEGKVEDMPEVYIFRCLEDASVSGRMARQTFRKIKSKYGNLPFAERWLTEDLSRIRLQMTLRELLASEALHPYYVLKEVNDCKVAQAEHTMIVTEEGCELTTKI